MIRKVIGDDGQKCRFDFDTSQLFKSQAHTWRINIIFRFIEIPTFIAHCIYFSSRQKPSGNITKVTFNLKWITKELKDVWKTHQLSLLPRFGSTIKTISKARQKKTHKKKPIRYWRNSMFAMYINIVYIWQLMILSCFDWRLNYSRFKCGSHFFFLFLYTFRKHRPTERINVSTAHTVCTLNETGKCVCILVFCWNSYVLWL